MPFCKIWIHLIWTTKERRKLIVGDIKRKLYEHIRENAKEKDIYIDHINGSDDHVHLLISLKPNQSLSNVVQLVKGESSHWVNKSEFSKIRFEWQDEYIALSVSESLVTTVRKYLQNQESHHKKKSFKEEYDLFIRKYGFDRYSG